MPDSHSADPILMPPRFLSLIIVVFWLGMAGWLFVRDLWPSLRPGEPPPYTFMASDEAPKQGSPVRWNVFHDGVHAYDLEAWTTYREKGDAPDQDDTFEMRARVRATKPLNRPAPVRRLRSLVRISRAGELRAVDAQLHLVVKDLELVLDVEGSALEGQLLPRWRVKVYATDSDSEERVFDRQPLLTSPPLFQFEAPFPPLEFVERGIVLDPLHPPNRLDTLRPGQHWRMPLVGSLLVLEAAAHALDALAQEPPPDQIPNLMSGLVSRAFDNVPLLEFQVLPQTQPLPASPEQTAGLREAPLCWVIEPRDAGGAVHARLWVQQSEGERQGLVLRQEVVLRSDRGEDTWIVQREQ
jgi:hypothetical protein